MAHRRSRPLRRHPVQSSFVLARRGASHAEVGTQSCTVAERTNAQHVPFSFFFAHVGVARYGCKRHVVAQCYHSTLSYSSRGLSGTYSNQSHVRPPPVAPPRTLCASDASIISARRACSRTTSARASCSFRSYVATRHSAPCRRYRMRLWLSLALRAAPPLLADRPPPRSRSPPTPPMVSQAVPCSHTGDLFKRAVVIT